jgi:hypothetical protein
MKSAVLLSHHFESTAITEFLVCQVENLPLYGQKPGSGDNDLEKLGFLGNLSH